MAQPTRSAVPYGKLAILVAFAISMPILGYWADQYVPVTTLFYGGKEHTGITFGYRTSWLLMFVGVLGLLGGLIYPRLALWAGENTRTRVLIVYGLTILLSFAPKYESRYLSGIIAANEDEKLGLVFRALQPGQSINAMRQTVKDIDSNIEQQGSDTSPFDGTDGFPYDGTPRQAIQFRYPAYFPKYETQSIVVAQLSADRSKPQAVAEKIILLKSGKLRDRKPSLAAGDRKRGQIYFPRRQV